VNSLSCFMKNEEKKGGHKSPAEKHYTSPTSIIKPPAMTGVNVVVCPGLHLRKNLPIVVEDVEQNLSPRLRWLLARLWQEWKQAETISLIPAQGSMRVMAISQQQVPSGESKMEKHVRGYHQR